MCSCVHLIIVKKCICGTDLEPPKPKIEIPSDYQKTVYRCHWCDDESSAPAECAYCDKEMSEVIVCSVCGETANKCYCDYEAIEKAAEESEEEEGSEESQDEK